MSDRARPAALSPQGWNYVTTTVQINGREDGRLSIFPCVCLYVDLCVNRCVCRPGWNGGAIINKKETWFRPEGETVQTERHEKPVSLHRAFVLARHGTQLLLYIYSVSPCWCVCVHGETIFFPLGRVFTILPPFNNK